MLPGSLVITIARPWPNYLFLPFVPGSLLSFNCLSAGQLLKEMLHPNAIKPVFEGSAADAGEVNKHNVFVFKLCRMLFLANKDNVTVALVHLLRHTHAKCLPCLPFLKTI